VRQGLRIAVVSGDGLTRAGLIRLLEAHRTWVDMVEAPQVDGRMAGYDVIVYDLRAIVEPGHSELPQVIASGTPVVALELPGRPDLTDLALAMGAADILTVRATSDQLWPVLERVAAGRTLDPDARRIELVNGVRAQAGLSVREADILTLIAAGLSNAEIAAALFMTINTVKTYIRSLYKRIGVTRRSKAVLWALQRGLGTQPEGSAARLGPHARHVQS
jgi:NarL family two-component system response regulator LiaR